ncbi:MAG TPA: M48 family metallopeptidase [Burkholderiaceae bacterium]|nr:M48 family metallopeptidase [Burkholderiaceae bacterium]
MRFENPLPDEHVNYSREHPLKELVWLLAGVMLVVAAVASVLGYFAGEIAARVPFRVERDYAAGITTLWENEKRTPQADEARAALRAMAAKLAAAMDLPPDMTITVHYSDRGVPNAMATLGGNVVLYRGLIERLHSEDALAVVLAHEMAHVSLRHPAAGLGRGVAVGITLSVVSAGLGRSMAGDPVQTAGVLPLLKYTRDQERAADAEALRAVAAVYGHLAGARELFNALAKIGGDDSARVTLLQTHPLTSERLATVDALARERGWALEGEVRPLPPALARLQAAAER